MFRDRNEAGRMLALKLRRFRNMPGVVLAVPRGGVPVAYEIARELELPLELILVKKLGHPLNPEYAIGAVGKKDQFIIPHEGVSDDYIRKETGRVRSRLLQMQKNFLHGREPESLEGKTVILVDDGIATGNTLAATLQVLKKQKPFRIIIAVPVLSKESMEKLKPEVDELISLMVPETFYGVGAFYEDFTQVTDEEVQQYLDRLMPFQQAG